MNYFRTGQFKPGDSVPEVFFEGHTGATGGTWRQADGRLIPDTLRYAAAFPRSLKQTTVWARAAIDPWETLASVGKHGYGDISFVRKRRPGKVMFLGRARKGATRF